MVLVKPDLSVPPPASQLCV